MSICIVFQGKGICIVLNPVTILLLLNTENSHSLCAHNALVIIIWQQISKLNYSRFKLAAYNSSHDWESFHHRNLFLCLQLHSWVVSNSCSPVFSWVCFNYGSYWCHWCTIYGSVFGKIFTLFVKDILNQHGHENVIEPVSEVLCDRASLRGFMNRFKGQWSFLGGSMFEYDQGWYWGLKDSTLHTGRLVYLVLMLEQHATYNY